MGNKKTTKALSSLLAAAGSDVMRLAGGWRRVRMLLLPAVVAVFSVAGIMLLSSSQASSLNGLRVSGNKIVNASGQTVRLVGVNDSGSEFACIQGWGFFDGPANDTSVKAIAGWKANVVRVPLNETCWLGINGAPAAYSGANYRNAIKSYVDVLTQNGFAVILELHWAAPGSEQATNQDPMPNRDHTPEFWRQVATNYKGYGNVLFDLYNEPFPDNNTASSSEGWRCWRDGGTCSGVSYQAAGMQELVNAVRGTGATNILMIGGIQYANSLQRWLEFKPNDPLNNMVAAQHIYNFNRCITVGCFDAEMEPVIRQYPLIIGEFGPDEKPDMSCTLTNSGFSKGLMDWLDARGQHYLAWNWDTWPNYCHALITDHSGTPTAVWGKSFKDRLAALNLYPGPSDTTRPSVSLTAPANGSSATVGSSVTLSANASDDTGVSKVEFYSSSTLLGSDTTRPYEISWNTAGQSAGTKTLTAKAYDAAGNVAESSAVSLNLTASAGADTIPPEVSITSPRWGDTVSGMTTISVTATDNVAVGRVDLLVDGALKGTVTTAPYGFSLDTTKLADGTRQLQAMAFDTAGNSRGSNIVAINVNNGTAALMPDVVVTSLTMTPANPRAGDKVVFTAVVKNQGNAPTPVGVPVGVAFYVNGKQTNWASRGELAAGESATMTATNSNPYPGVNYWTAVEGNHGIEAYADDIQRFAESNEDNNKLQISAKVSPARQTGDANGDGRVNAIDLSIIISRDGQNYEAADFNGDGIVGAADLAILLSKWTW